MEEDERVEPVGSESDTGSEDSGPQDDAAEDKMADDEAREINPQQDYARGVVMQSSSSGESDTSDSDEEGRLVDV